MTGRVELRAAPPFEDMLEITSNLRERDREEIFATQYGDDPAAVASTAVATGSFRWGAYLDGRPVAAIGAVPRWPNVWTAWAYGTDEWPRVVLSLTRHTRRFILPALYRAGAIRVDALALESHNDARAWLEYLGAEPHFTLENWGRDGQTFVHYVWTRKQTKDLLDRGFRRRKAGRVASPEA